MRFHYLLFIAFWCLLLTACTGPENQANDGKQKTSKQSENNARKNELEKDTAYQKPAWLKDANIVDFLKHYGKENPENKIKISTPYGDIVVELFEETPLHRANMIYLVKDEEYFNGTLFYRVVKDFIIQAGQKDDERTQEKRFLIGKYTIPKEMNTPYFHELGAVSMARNYTDNPEKRSSPYDFFIIVGRKQTDFGLDMIEKEYGIELTPYQRKIYMERGSAPHLDGEHTVIGRVVSGLDLAIAISKKETDGGEWPLVDIPITIDVIP